MFDFFQGSLNATFRAISQTPKAPNVGPVAASALARRRNMNRVKGSADVWYSPSCAIRLGEKKIAMLANLRKTS